MSGFDENDEIDLGLSPEEAEKAAEGGSRLPGKGEHDAEVIEASLGRSRAGNPQMVLRFACYSPSGDHLGDITAWVPLHVPFRKAEMKAALDRKGDPAGKVRMGPFTRYEGRVCRVRVKYEEWEGRTTSKVDKLLPPTDEQLATEQRAAEPF